MPPRQMACVLTVMTLATRSLAGGPSSIVGTDLSALSGQAIGVAISVNDRGDIAGDVTPLNVRPFLLRRRVMVDLGNPPVGFFSTFGMNDRGDLAGVGRASNSLRARLWQDGVFRDLEPVPGATSSVATAINNRGQVAGYSFGSALSPYHATLWDHDVPIDLGTLPDMRLSVATALSAEGDVVGYSGNSWMPRSRAFLWRDRNMIDLGTLPGGISSFATGVNNRGQIVGASDDVVVGRGVLWDNGTAIDLGANLAPRGINDNGQIVGIDVRDDQVTRGFIWRNGVITELLPADGYVGCWATAINDRGQAVGVSFGANGEETATLWEAR